MATLVVEDGTGVVTANGYATVAEIDEILSYQATSSGGWTPLDETAKGNLIIWASQILDQRVRWEGRKLHETSGLAWPRCGVIDREGFPVDEDVVPTAVKQAVAVLANHLITFNPNEVNENANLTMLQADVITLKFDPYADVYKFPDMIGFILRGLGWVSMGRGGPKRIIKH
ncbi:virion structural protein [Erythrobacter phage vB_EliS-L02]|nr:virion structural protein [Erythrobacter phage vB_EliS-L02]